MTNNKGFTLKDIKGAVVEKKDTKQKWQRRNNINPIENTGFNLGIDAQSSVRLRMNRERLAKTLYHHHCLFTDNDCVSWDKLLSKSIFYRTADQIIANQTGIIEVVKESE